MNNTQESILLFTVIYFINTHLGTNYDINSFSIKYHNNNESSILAFHIFSNDINHVINIYVYLQLGDVLSISEPKIENIDKVYSLLQTSVNVSDSPLNIYLEDNYPLNIVVSMLVSNLFLELNPGNIFPLDYTLTNMLTTSENIDLLVVNTNALLVNGDVLLLNTN